MTGHGISISEERCLHLTINETVNIVEGKINREEFKIDHSKQHALLFQCVDKELSSFFPLEQFHFYWNMSTYYVDMCSILIPGQIQKLAIEPFVVYHTQKRLLRDTRGENPVSMYADVFLQARLISPNDKIAIQQILYDDFPIVVCGGFQFDAGLYKVRQYIDTLLEGEKGDGDD